MLSKYSMIKVGFLITTPGVREQASIQDLAQHVGSVCSLLSNKRFYLGDSSFPL